MSQTLVWMHHYALSENIVDYPPFTSLSACIFVWDDNYFRNLNYSLKRLVFIYETLCELPVEIIQGDMISVLAARPESIIYVAESQDKFIHKAIQVLQETKQLIQLAEKPFINTTQSKDHIRFSAYWRQVESMALSIDGGFHDKNG